MQGAPTTAKAQASRAFFANFILLGFLHANKPGRTCDRVFDDEGRQHNFNDGLTESYLCFPNINFVFVCELNCPIWRDIGWDSIASPEQVDDGFLKHVPNTKLIECIGVPTCD